MSAQGVGVESENGARAAAAVVGRALEDVWDHLLGGALVSLLWLLLVLLVIPGPPATVALVAMARRIQTRDEIGPRAYLRAVAAHFGLGWRWGAAALPVALVLIVDWWVVGGWSLPPTVGFAARLLSVAALGFWLLVNFYALPLLFAQARPAVLSALRNGGVMVLRNPAYSLVVGGAALLFTLVGMWLAIVGALAGPIFVAFLASRAVDERLANWRAQQVFPPEQAPNPANRPITADANKS